MYITMYVGSHSLKLRDAFSKVIFLFFLSNQMQKPNQSKSFNYQGSGRSSLQKYQKYNNTHFTELNFQNIVLRGNIRVICVHFLSTSWCS